MSGRLGELLVRENLITVQALRKAQEEQQKSGTRIGTALIKTGAIEESKLTDFLSKQYGVPAINLKDFDVDPEIIKLVPKEVAEKHLVIPVNRAGPSLIVAMCDPSNIYAVDDLKFLTGYNIESVVASEISIREAIERYYAEKGPSLDDIVGEVSADDIEVSKEEDENIEEMAKAADDAPVVKLVNLILMDAIKKRASDIHVEPYEKDFRVRFRIDGSLYEVMRPPMRLRNAITSRLKIMAELDISERRLPQDGRIKIKMGQGKEMDFRVSVCPTLFGEKIVMRLLDKSNLQLDMTKLGFDPQPLAWFKEAIERPYGMVLVTGPTGSGKTTTLYSALSSLNQIDTNISTAEDPVEFNFAGINQVQMHEDIGLNFAASLRSFLRQDPDIIMIGEIRDFETGEIAVKAALTGHLVLSTLHTNDAPGTVSRLLNMGIEPFLVTASLNLILAQRLCRRLCKDCKRPAASVDEAALIEAGIPAEKMGTFTVYEKVGCRECNDRGYRGRVAVYEVMPFWDGLKELVINGASTNELKQEAIRLGMSSLRMSALAKLMEGVTTLEEVVGNTAPDRF
ncbi:type IV-A pilus assembly ATPase PilB [Stigmatella aurantiaca]|uniref:Type IV-A pilus assembly ATPase PilB n=1 Tax=Stigmatella aurantiaca (strain DW4/3-1) TaxID=378806 RepID=Q08YY5_STIAD|nr:type IV-A pilus assembly ATPase PilB [Stigmatella aurantiaca]ADO74215.1 Type IV-A pilus assembly ATPase PilB [Stigmatella aurantiaca DW4/3-1]EAU65707.1 type IV-A pilus assembly ATPase PilB [Stigmatella aurantiaca DW4/3-1]